MAWNNNRIVLYLCGLWQKTHFIWGSYFHKMSPFRISSVSLIFYPIIEQLIRKKIQHLQSIITALHLPLGKMINSLNLSESLGKKQMYRLFTPVCHHSHWQFNNSKSIHWVQRLTNYDTYNGSYFSSEYRGGTNTSRLSTRKHSAKTTVRTEEPLQSHTMWVSILE